MGQSFPGGGGALPLLLASDGHTQPNVFRRLQLHRENTHDATVGQDFSVSRRCDVA